MSLCEVKSYQRLLIYKILRISKSWILENFRYICLMPLIVENHFYEKKYGNIETSEYFKYEDTESVYRDANGYGPTHYRLLHKIFKILKLNQNDIILDIGCGKGRVLAVAAQYQIRKCDGVELNSELIAVGRNNIKKLKSLNTEINIIHDDAVNINLDEYNVVYYFQSLGLEGTRRLLKNLQESWQRKPRLIRFVYVLPVYKDFFDKCGWLKRSSNMTKSGIIYPEVIIYTTNISSEV